MLNWNGGRRRCVDVDWVTLCARDLPRISSPLYRHCAHIPPWIMLGTLRIYRLHYRSMLRRERHCMILLRHRTLRISSRHHRRGI